MSMAELSALADDELRVKVAEACGWKQFRPDRWGQKCADDSWRMVDKPPRFTKSLDACASFERTMSEDDAATYLMHLCDRPTRFDQWTREQARVCLSASPRQRCIAFLATKPTK